MSEATPGAIEVGLVLQGGGALGAYEYGGILALLELIDDAVARGQQIALKAVTGVSIGAINAACVVGAASRADARARLTALWSDFVVEAPPLLPQWVASDLSLYSVPNFYNARTDFLNMRNWTHVYDTHPLLGTLAKHVDFAALNASDTALVVTAVDVERGEIKRFANRQVGKTPRTVIEPKHVLASGSLPPGFPWTDIAAGAETRHYWDGGLVDNTPLGEAIDAFTAGPGVTRLLVVMNLFPEQARLPQTYAEVSGRLNQLHYGNRMHQDTKNAGQINELVSTIEDLVKLVPGALPPELEGRVADARTLKLVEPIEIALVSDAVAYRDASAFRDFSGPGIEARRKAGRALTLDKLRSKFDSAIA